MATVPKIKINKATAIKEIIELLKQKGTYTSTLAIFLSKYSLSNPTFQKYWKEAKQKYTEQEAKLQAKVQAKVEAALTDAAVTRAVHELETKDGQVDELVAQALEVKQEIQTGISITFAWYKGKYCQKQITLTHKEINEKRQLLAKLLADIRQIRGLNAAIKQETLHDFESLYNKWMETGDIEIIKETVATDKPMEEIKP